MGEYPVMRIVLRLLPWIALALLGPAAPALAQIDGNYETIGPVPPRNSQDVVVLEEFLNFTCPHCNNFRKVAKPLFSKYGDRIERRNLPILFRGQSDTVLRLYFIAERLGRGHEIKEMIFDATFQYGVNINDPKVVGFLARSAGLAEEFESQRGADWVNAKIRASHARAERVGVEATPTIVLNGAIRMVPRTGMQTFVNNLDRVIGQLLKERG